VIHMDNCRKMAVAQGEDKQRGWPRYPAMDVGPGGGGGTVGLWAGWSMGGGGGFRVCGCWGLWCRVVGRGGGGGGGG